MAAPFAAPADPLTPASDKGLAPLKLELPRPAFIGTPPDLKDGEHLEPYKDEPGPPLMVPAGVQNVALGKRVTCSDPRPYYGTPALVTDGDKEATDDSYIELHRKTQYFQIDLAETVEIHAVAIWHAHSIPQVYRAVVVQVADDRDFTVNVRTLFNNDHENVSGLGQGTDKQYWESRLGKLIPVKAQRARYLRAYSRGSTFSELNRCTEIEVYALPVGNQAGTGSGV